MTRSKEERPDAAIDRIVNAYYKAGYRRLTKDEAVDIIRAEREKYLFKPGLSWGARHRKQRVYARGLSWDLIRIIRDSPEEDPIKIVNAYIYEMDDIMRESSSDGVIDFCQIAIEAASDILEILEIKE
jgi:hypothetical protein